MYARVLMACIVYTINIVVVNTLVLSVVYADHQRADQRAGCVPTGKRSDGHRNARAFAVRHGTHSSARIAEASESM